MSVWLAIFCSAFAASAVEYRRPLTPAASELVCAYAGDLVVTGLEYGLDPFMLAALIYEESRWIPTAVSKAGACGLTQVLPRYSGGFTCEQLKDPSTSIRVGAQMLDRWVTGRKRPVYKALACYNAGNVCEKSTRARKYSNRIRALARRARQTFRQQVEQHYAQCMTQGELLAHLQESSYE